MGKEEGRGVILHNVLERVGLGFLEVVVAVDGVEPCV